MKYLILIVALLFSPLAFTQTRLLPVECGTIKDLSEAMVSFEEKPLATGETKRSAGNRTIDSVVIFFLNKKTGTWTVAEKIGNDVYCIISSGSNFVIIEPETKL